MCFLKVNAQNSVNDYYQYYYQIYKAEKNICNYKYDEALVNYNKAFQMVNYKSYYDMHNAAICALYSDEYKSLNIIMESLLKQGFSLDFINKDVIDELLVGNYLNIKIDSLRLLFEQNIDSVFAKECFQRHDKDQQINKKRIRESSVNNLKEFNKIVYDNIQWVNNIIDSIGYPNRTVLGYEVTEADNPVSIMIVHYLQHKSNKAFPFLKTIDFFKYEEDSIINEYDRIPLLEKLGGEVLKGNLFLGEYINYHNIIRSIFNGRFFYKEYYNSEKLPAIFSEERDVILMDMSENLLNSINTFENKDSLNFILGRNTYRLETTKNNNISMGN